MPTGSARVGVVGLGLMGGAMARAFVAGGHEVAVWNRSPAAAEAFAGSAAVARSVAELVAASDVVVSCLLSPDACRAALRHADVEAALAGRLLVQLTTTTPADAADEARWATAHGARYLGGAILGAPALVGTDRVKVVYSGPRAHFEESAGLLEALTPTWVWCGEEYGRAATMDHALLEVSYGSLAVLLHAMALCEAGSVPVEEFLAQVTVFRDGFVAQRAASALSGEYPSGTASMWTFESWAEQLRRTAESLGVATALPDLLVRAIDRAIELGHGDDDYQALVESFRAGRGDA